MVYYIYIVKNVDNTIHNIIIGIIYILMLSYFYNDEYFFLSFRIKTQRSHQDILQHSILQSYAFRTINLNNMQKTWVK